MSSAVDPPRRSTLAEAEQRVRDWVYDWKPGMNRNMEFPLIERTTSEVWSVLGVQVFQIDPSQPILGYTNFLLHADRVDSIGAGFGGFGLMSLCAADLDGDGQDELVYSYSWGSGLHRTQFAAWIAGEGHGRQVVAATSFASGDVRLAECADGSVALIIAPYRHPGRWGPDEFELGVLFFDRARGLLDVQPAEELPPSIANQMWRGN